jgi:hypothetical protein
MLLSRLLDHNTRATTDIAVLRADRHRHIPFRTTATTNHGLDAVRNVRRVTLLRQRTRPVSKSEGKGPAGVGPGTRHAFDASPFHSTTHRILRGSLLFYPVPHSFGNGVDSLFFRAIRSWQLKSRGLRPKNPSHLWILRDISFLHLLLLRQLPMKSGSLPWTMPRRSWSTSGYGSSSHLLNSRFGLEFISSCQTSEYFFTANIWTQRVAHPQLLTRDDCNAHWEDVGRFESADGGSQPRAEKLPGHHRIPSPGMH